MRNTFILHNSAKHLISERADIPIPVIIDIDWKTRLFRIQILTPP